MRCLNNELVECESDYANLEAMAAETQHLHAGTLLAMEAKYLLQV